MRCRREGAGDHEALKWEVGVSPGAQPAAAVAAEAPCSSWRGEFPVHGLDVEQRLSSYSQAGHWSLQCPSVSSLLQGQGSGAASTAAPNEHMDSLEPDLECASWDRCHLAEMSHGRGVTWQKCHLGELSLCSPVDS